MNGGHGFGLKARESRLGNENQAARDCLLGRLFALNTSGNVRTPSPELPERKLLHLPWNYLCGRGSQGVTREKVQSGRGQFLQGVVVVPSGTISDSFSYGGYTAQVYEIAQDTVGNLYVCGQAAGSNGLYWIVRAENSRLNSQPFRSPAENPTHINRQTTELPFGNRPNF